ncbi:NAD-dependent epimerase/dehydratase family protein [Pontimicrobium sp. MEBiC01747]
MKSIIISGISGFMGSNLKPYLNKNYTVFGLSRKENEIENTINYDEVFKKGLDNYLAFIHLAGKAHDLKKTSDNNAYFETNTDLTIKLFDLFLESKCEVFIFMSTVKAIADSVDNVLTEESVPNPKTAYGKSKRAAEEYILSKKIPENKKVYILRPCMVHGPNNKGNLNLLYKIISKGIPYPLGNFDNRRSFLSIDNLCYCTKELLHLKPEGICYQLADDMPISTNKLVSIIAETIGKPTRIVNFPKFMFRIIARIGDIIPLFPINTDKLGKLTENYVVSNSKITDAIGKMPISTEIGIKKTIQSFL